MVLAGLQLVLLTHFVPPHIRPPKELAVEQAETDELDQIISVDFHSVDIRTALAQIFKKASRYKLDPHVQGLVTAKLKECSVNVVLQTILRQLGATYRVDGGVTYIVPKSDYIGCDFGFLDSDVMPEYVPGRFSSSFPVRNPQLSLTPARTMGSSYDLLAKAATAAGYKSVYAYRYGKEGFALVLPMESFESNGQSSPAESRFPIVPSMDHIDFRDVQAFGMRAIGAKTGRFRIAVLLVSAEPITLTGAANVQEEYRSPGDFGIPDSMRNTKWTDQPKLTVLVYEFSRKLAEPKVDGKTHAIGLGLWPIGKVY